MKRVEHKTRPILKWGATTAVRLGAVLGGLWWGEVSLPAQATFEVQAPRGDHAPGNAAFPDYSVPAKPFPHVNWPYRPRRVSEPSLTNSPNAPLTVEDGKLRLSIAQLVAAVVANNPAVVAARLYPSMAQTDLLRARSGASPRGVDQSVIPSSVFAGAQGGSILGSAAGFGGSAGGGSNAGGITGGAGAVSIRPAGLFDPIIAVSASIDRTVSPLNSLIVAGVPQVSTRTLAFSATYIQAFSSGTSFNVSYSAQRQNSTQLHLLFDPFYVPGFTASVSQQMLNGFGFKVNRVLLEVAQNERAIEREAFRQQVVTSLVSAENAYWDLIAAQQAVRAAAQALRAAEQLEDNSKKELAVGLLAAVDVLTAESQVAASRRDLIVAQTNVLNAEFLVKNLISLTLEEPLASATIEATDAFPEPDDARLPSLSQAVEIANRNRPELAVARGNIKSQTDVLPFIKNELLPSVNVFVQMSTVGLYDAFGTSFSEAVRFKYPQIAFGVSISFPLHNRQAQADELRSRLELQQAKDALVRTQSQVALSVQTALIATIQSRAQVAGAQAAVRLASQQLDAEQKKLAAGLATPYNVILIQRDLFNAQLAEVQAQDAYAKARVAIDQSMGTTLENRHIELDAALRGSGVK